MTGRIFSGVQMSMIIRRYESKDWGAICDIFNRAKPDELRGSIEPNAIVPLHKDEMLLKSFNDSILYVAEVKEKVIGYIGYSEALISFLFVDPNYYKTGIGTKLLEIVLPEVGEKAWLRVAKININAQELYRKFGFKVVEEFIGKYNGCNVEVLILALNPQLESWKIKKANN